MNDHPAMIAPVNHVEPVPRRIRAFLGGEKVLDTTRALYVWEWPYYPNVVMRSPWLDICLTFAATLTSNAERAQAPPISVLNVRPTFR